MDKRFVLALFLTSLVVIATPLLFPSPRRVSGPLPVSGDSILREISPIDTVQETISSAPRTIPEVSTVVPRSSISTPVDTTKISGGNADFRFSNLGARLLSAELHHFRSYRPGKEIIALRGATDPLVWYRLLDASGDTIRLDSMAFERSETPSGITYRTRTAIGIVVIEYSVITDSYMVRVTGHIEAQTEPGTLLVSLPGGIRSEEADTLDDREHLAFAVKTRRDNARRVQFKDLDPGESDTTPGPVIWAASKNKYFLTALLAPAGGEAFNAVLITGGTRTAKSATRADIMVARTLALGQPFSFEVYAGPQEWKRLHALGRDFENVNPYGGFMQGLIQPFATMVMRVLLWMRETFKISYGWVLVLFGIMVRIITWPLNQSAMKTSLRMQRIQPQLAVVQQKYKNNQEKQREEIMQVYREHGMTPFSPLMGCLPMLLPMPVLFALFFVFQNTIEFRGVPFLWLPDISLHDPLYIIPLVMGISMYALSWIGMRNAPPNPQAKMMGYFLPVMMTVLFWRFASGLNLYYTIQNIAALPQQWLIARDRGKPSLVTNMPATPARR